MLSSEAEKLRAVIEKTIDDHEITTSEYERIIALANRDLHIDVQERRLLAQLQELIESGMVARRPG